MVVDLEMVYVFNFFGICWDIGWLYGNLCGVLVIVDENYVVVVGCGVLVVDLICFGEEVVFGEIWV